MTTHNNELIYERYRIIEELSRGGFGITFLAKDKLLDNLLCVVKKLEPQKADVETAKKLFQREAAILAYVNQNQQIPKYLNYFEDEQNYYLVEEYIEGKTLDKLAVDCWTQRETVVFLEEILAVLEYLHEKNIIHRDIKPANLIKRESDNKFVLIDFGAVKKIDNQYLVSEQNPIQTIIYSQGYGSPEQMEGQPRLNSDIYSLGMTAIQLLTGISPRELIRNERDEVILEGVNPSLASILIKMVYRDRSMRYQSATEVIEDLELIENDVPTTQISNRTRVNSQQGTSGNYQSQQSQTLSTFVNNKYQFLLLSSIFLIILFIGIEFTNPWVRPLYYLHEGNRLLDEDKLNSAFTAFANLKALKPNSSQAWKGQGDVLFRNSRYNKALAYYEKAISIEPNYVKALINKGKLLYLMGRYEQALKTYMTVLKLEPNNPDALSGKGIAYMGQRQFQKASACFEQVRILQPDDPRIWRDIGFAVENLQNKQAAKTYFEEALKSYDEFLDKKPNKPIYWTDRGSVLLKLDSPQEALESFNKALKINNQLYEALMGKANAQNILREHQAALSTFNQAAEIRPRDYLVWYNRGEILLHVIKDYQQALESFEKATKLRSIFHPAWIGKGLAFLELERYVDALRAFDKAKEIAPKDPFIWANRGYALKKLNREQEAQQSYQEAIKLGFPPEQINQ
ncbi:MAG: tetratricopeptide repeat protein [Calothrix sp. MO_167.B12]|nr:tetratricopeptide repeat protein [Calothrix sp. MO_167.B12]